MIAAILLLGAAPVDDLFRRNAFAAMGSDLKASSVGDLLTVVVYQIAEASDVAKTDSARSTALGGGISASGLDERGDLSFGGSYRGGGQVQRSQRFITQITVAVDAVLPNGDLHVVGRQRLRINGEVSDIGVRGRIRPADITGDNRVLSTRIADAEIDYDGRGFVTRSAKPGVINRVFRFLGLG
jgi:flagellar L-ring protein precursor FlgH